MFNAKKIGLGGAAAWAVVTVASAASSSGSSQGQIAAAIKADVAEIVAGINAHDVERSTKFDAPDIVTMESGRPPGVGMAADKQGLGEAFKQAPSWRVRLVEETVDVSSGGDMAVYRSTYNQDSDDDKGRPMTQKVNFVAGFRREGDGAWKMHWSVVCANEKPHLKA
jgi:ketosteroid isomerase-like protein